MSTEQQTVIISGASGLVGRTLSASFAADGWRVRPLVRREAQSSDEIAWSPERGLLDRASLAGAQAVVHLAGESVSQRWNVAVKRKIRDSRTKSTHLLASAIAQLDSRPRVFVSASAIGFYGNRGDEWVDEDSPSGNDFLAEVCREWEAACEPAWQAGIRVCQARVGLVLAPEGGVLGKLLTPFKLGMGGIAGDGRQYMSWIERGDLVRAIRTMIDRDELHGAFNCVAPGPVTNEHFTKALGAALHRPTIVPAPAFALRLMFGEMADALLLAGQRVRPKRLLDAGFEFTHSEIEPTLALLVGSS